MPIDALVELVHGLTKVTVIHGYLTLTNGALGTINDELSLTVITRRHFEVLAIDSKHLSSFSHQLTGLAPGTIASL